MNKYPFPQNKKTVNNNIFTTLEEAGNDVRRESKQVLSLKARLLPSGEKVDTVASP